MNGWLVLLLLVLVFNFGFVLGASWQAYWRTQDAIEHNIRIKNTRYNET